MSEETPVAQNRIPTNIADEMRQSYMDYAMSVIIGRALPDVKDGLKPVHRRVLYAMHESSHHWNRAHVKSARVVGEVMGKYHPHGDSAIYDTLVRMAQPFSLRYPLIDAGQAADMTDEISPSLERRFVRGGLPWMIGAGALVLYLASLHHRGVNSRLLSSRTHRHRDR